MNYSKIYNLVCERGQKRKLLPGTVYEKHHILPKCKGGTDDVANLATLTPKEHYLAHKLLVLMYPGDEQLFFAFWAMCMLQKDSRFVPSGRTYQNLKEEFSTLRRKRLLEKNPNLGRRKLSRDEGFISTVTLLLKEETLAAVSDILGVHPNTLRKFILENNITYTSKRGQQVKSQTTRNKISASKKGKLKPGFKNTGTFSKGHIPWNKGTNVTTKKATEKEFACFNRQGELIKVYRTIPEAVHDGFGAEGVRRCLIGTNKTTGKHSFKYL